MIRCFGAQAHRPRLLRWRRRILLPLRRLPPNRQSQSRETPRSPRKSPSRRPAPGRRRRNREAEAGSSRPTRAAPPVRAFRLIRATRAGSVKTPPSVKSSLKPRGRTVDRRGRSGFASPPPAAAQILAGFQVVGGVLERVGPEGRLPWLATVRGRQIPPAAIGGRQAKRNRRGIRHRSRTGLTKRPGVAIAVVITGLRRSPNSDSP